jgi:hypothetical protein
MKLLRMGVAAALVLSAVSCTRMGHSDASGGASSPGAEPPSMSGSSLGSVVGPDSKRARSTEPAVRTR